MLSMVVQVRAPKAAVTTRSVFMALPLSCFSAWIMAAWRDELTQTRGEEQICGAACGQLHTDEDRRRRDRRRWDDVHLYQGRTPGFAACSRKRTTPGPKSHRVTQHGVPGKASKKAFSHTETHIDLSNSVSNHQPDAHYK